MTKHNIAVLGSNGMLGFDVIRTLQKCRHNVIGFSRPMFDITNHDHLIDAVSNVEIIINCAAYTNVDGAESNQLTADAVNAVAVGELGKIVKKLNKYLIHLSTDFVYDGRKNGVYIESDDTNPLNVYGKSKLKGETLLINSGCRHCILRLEWTYGHNGTGFINKILDRTKTPDSLTIVNDQHGSPTATAEAARLICKLVENQAEGLYLFAAKGYATRYEIAQFIIDNLNLKTTLIPCASDYSPAPAKRPLNSKFNCNKIDSLFPEFRTDWDSTLGNFLKEMK